MKFYNQLAATYDLFIDWEKRIQSEDAFFQHLWQERMATSILDLGCGTGGHDIYWAEMGYNVVGIDSAKEMIAYARRLSEEKEIDIEFQCLRLTDFASKIQQRFDSVVCLGNTLPHLLNEDDVKHLFQQTIESMKPTGLAVFHLLNYARYMAIKKRDFPVKTRIVDGREYLFIRSYDYQPDWLSFNFTVAVKEEDTWTSRSHQVKHIPWQKVQLVDLARESGFSQVMCYGGYDFSEFDSENSNDLILVCETGDED